MTERARVSGPGAREVRFDNGGRAALAVAGTGDDPSALLAKVGLAGTARRPVIVVCGGADELREPYLSVARAILGPAVRVAAQQTSAAVVDGGTAVGVMELIGAERAGAGATFPVLLGVAPAGLVTHPGASGDGRAALEPHHTHFVLADSAEWGGETQLLAGIAQELAGGAPVVMVLAGGGSIALSEATEAVARRWPLFVIEGTGGAADAIAAVWRRHREPRRRRVARWLPTSFRYAAPAPVAQIEDPDLRRIVTDGDARRVADPEPRALARSLLWELQDEGSLKDAWVLFATYDGLAGRLRTTFEQFQGAILVLGILATLVALVHNEVGGAVLHWTVVAAPIVVSVLIALANRRAAGKRWVLLRAAAEAIKSEIYRYRTGTGVYADEPATGDDLAARPRRLADQLDTIEGKLTQSDASSGPLTPYDGPLPPAMYGAEAADDGLSPLDAERYVKIRLADQLSYYRGKVRDLDRRRAILQVITVTAGGAGAILAAAGLEIWIGLTTALSVAALAHLGYLQIDNTIVAYNQSAARLAGLEREFRARQTGPLSPEAFHDLVTRGETVLTTELGGWVQQMNDAIHALQAQQSDAASKVEDQHDDPTTAQRPEGERPR
jgi:SLOG in TRPM, prokaryote/SMODS and SLOG-associating 2TM effector domain 1/Protein of unknown function (DUF4231)